MRKTFPIRQNNFDELSLSIKKNSDLISLDRSHIEFLSSFAIPIICVSPEVRQNYFEQFSGAGIEIRPMIAGNIQKQPFYKKYNVKWTANTQSTGGVKKQLSQFTL